MELNGLRFQNLNCANQFAENPDGTVGDYKIPGNIPAAIMEADHKQARLLSDWGTSAGVGRLPGASAGADKEEPCNSASRPPCRSLVPAHRYLFRARNLFQHHQRGIAFGGPVGLKHLGVHDQPEAVHPKRWLKNCCALFVSLAFPASLCGGEFSVGIRF